MIYQLYLKEEQESSRCQMEDGKKKNKTCERAQNNETGKLGQGIAIWSGFNNVRVPGHEAEETD